MRVVTGWPEVVVLTATVKGWRAAAEDISRLGPSTTSCTYCRSVSQNMVVYRTCRDGEGMGGNKESINNKTLNIEHASIHNILEYIPKLDIPL